MPPIAEITAVAPPPGRHPPVTGRRVGAGWAQAVPATVVNVENAGEVADCGGARAKTVMPAIEPVRGRGKSQVDPFRRPA